jgi:hypothetical protein
MEPNFQEIEINGVKMQVDLRYAKRIEEIRVGSRVKVLTKEYSGHKVNHGVVIGFDPFKERPTIIIAYIEVSYSTAEIKFCYYNKDTKDTEVVIAIDADEAALDRDEILRKLDFEVEKRKREIEDFEAKKKYFLDKFATYWQPVQKESAEAA